METLIERIEDELSDIRDTIGYCMEKAGRCFDGADLEFGKAYLIAMCRTISNYEEIIELEELTEQWERYRPLVAEWIPASITVNGSRAKAPSECAMTIGQILEMEDDDLLTELSAHIGELSGMGDSLGSLNKWERAFYYADELIMEVNSGGFEGYLYYHGTHFDKSRQAFREMGANEMESLLDAVQAKFPRGKVPKSEGAIQNAMDRLEDRGVDFEDEDDRYYGGAECKLLDRMAAWVRENGKRFR